MYTFKLRRATPSEWASSNPILADGEPGFEKDTNKLKIGDGIHRWLELSYISSSSLVVIPVDSDALMVHVNDLAPHPVYDDGPSLVLLYENQKV